MEALNSVEARSATPQQRMQMLEKEIAAADQRIRMRRNVTSRVSLSLGVLAAVPLSMYMVYHLFAPSGVMQNYKASSGAYLYWLQNFMYRPKTFTEMFRPEIWQYERASSLH